MLLTLNVLFQRFEETPKEHKCQVVELWNDVIETQNMLNKTPPNWWGFYWKYNIYNIC